MNKHHRVHRGTAAIAAVGLILASCSGSSDDADESPDATETEASDEADAAVDTAADDAATDGEAVGDQPAETQPDTTEAPADDESDEPADDESNDDESGDDESGDDGAESESDETAAAAGEGFGVLEPASGEPIVLGMVNTEGPPGLDFPEMRTDTELALAYLNEHGGFGGRPVVIEHCTAAGSPESSENCAQDLTGKGVDLAMIGFDLFPGYDTFTAASTPVVGALPILPTDYTADALFVTGGNATTMAAMVALAVEEFDAKTVGIVSADNIGANGSEAALTASLDKAGITYKSVKGGDTETDAGFEGLMREANSENPDLMISLYSDAGCIGAMRGRVSLGITTPMVSTAICGSAEIIDVVGDDAVGWHFIAVGAPEDTVTAAEFDEIIEPTYGSNADSSLGIGALGITLLMSLARVANAIDAEGGEVTGDAIYERMETSSDILNFPNDSPLTCGITDAYPNVCNFEFPVGSYVEGGGIATVPGFEMFSVLEYLA